MDIARTDKKTISELVLYLGATLGLMLKPREWPGKSKLPYYLNDLYHFIEITVFGQACIAMVEIQNGQSEPAKVRKHVDFIRRSFDQPIIFVTAALSAYDRKRLIENRVQFIVPGNQMFIPELGMDLREHFKARMDKIEIMGPATQAMLIRQLSTPWANSLQTDDYTIGRGYGALGLEFDYSRMTISRSVKELESLGLISLVDNLLNRIDDHPVQDVSIKMSSVELWKKARRHMKSPIKKIVWLDTVPDMAPLLIAGESALALLAKETMLADPKVPVYAMGLDRYKKLSQAKLVHEVHKDEAACELQLWLYEPLEIWKWAPCVDVFSLIMSFAHEDDPRIQMCITELEEQIA
jgi:hypothetical protein